MSLIVEVRNLSYTYEDGTQALKGVDFDLEEGATVALLGANGSGKTTFVHHLNGILRVPVRLSSMGFRLPKKTFAKFAGA